MELLSTSSQRLLKCGKTLHRVGFRLGKDRVKSVRFMWHSGGSGRYFLPSGLTRPDLPGNCYTYLNFPTKSRVSDWAPLLHYRQHHAIALREACKEAGSVDEDEPHG